MLYKTTSIVFCYNSSQFISLTQHIPHIWFLSLVETCWTSTESTSSLKNGAFVDNKISSHHHFSAIDRLYPVYTIPYRRLSLTAHVLFQSLAVTPGVVCVRLTLSDVCLRCVTHSPPFHRWQILCKSTSICGYCVAACLISHHPAILSFAAPKDQQ